MAIETAAWFAWLAILTVLSGIYLLALFIVTVFKIGWLAAKLGWEESRKGKRIR